MMHLYTSSKIKRKLILDIFFCLEKFTHPTCMIPIRVLAVLCPAITAAFRNLIKHQYILVNTEKNQIFMNNVEKMVIDEIRYIQNTLVCVTIIQVDTLLQSNRVFGIISHIKANIFPNRLDHQDTKTLTETSTSEEK